MCHVDYILTSDNTPVRLRRQYVRLLSIEDSILLFFKIPCHKKCFKIVNETTSKMYDFILEFYNTKFYVVSLVIYGMK
jgi:mannose/fructose/N-acetylgalactosamine-specific phosphotransferase system component IID